MPIMYTNYLLQQPIMQMISQSSQDFFDSMKLFKVDCYFMCNKKCHNTGATVSPISYYYSSMSLFDNSTTVDQPTVVHKILSGSYSTKNNQVQIKTPHHATPLQK